MSSAEIHQSGIQVLRRRSACRHVRIVGPHDLDSAQVHLLQSIEIRLPAVFFAEVICHNLRLDQFRRRRVCRITRIRHQNLVSLVQKSQGDQQYGFLGADQRLYFCLRVELYSIPAGIPLGESLAQLRQADIALVGVAAGLEGRGAEGADGLLRRHPVWRADAEIDDRLLACSLTRSIHGCDLLELAREVIFLDRFGPVCWADYHIADVYSPKILKSSINGLTAERACS